jgi:hypothetical protein
VCWPAKSMTAAQPRVASRAAPHGGGPAYLPRLKQAKGGTTGAARRWRGCYRGRTAGDVQRSSTMTACEGRNDRSTRRAAWLLLR